MKSRQQLQQIITFLLCTILLTSSFHLSLPRLNSSFSSLCFPYNRILNINTKININNIPSGGSLATTVLPSNLNSYSNLSNSSKSRLQSFYHIVSSFYATFSILIILFKSLNRLLPIALIPLYKPLHPCMYVMYILTILTFAYSEGYKGFQKKFIPFVVSRSQHLRNEPIIYKLVAPLYTLGLIKSTAQRKIKSITMIGTVGIMVALTKKLSYPYRNVIDAGMVIGLGWGCVSGVVEWVLVSLGKKKCNMDLCFLEQKSKIGDKG